MLDFEKSSLNSPSAIDILEVGWNRGTGSLGTFYIPSFYIFIQNKYSSSSFSVDVSPFVKLTKQFLAKVTAIFWMTMYFNRWDGNSRLLAFKIILLFFFLPDCVNGSLKSTCIQPSKIPGTISTSRSKTILGGFVSFLTIIESEESFNDKPFIFKGGE